MNPVILQDFLKKWLLEFFSDVAVGIHPGFFFLGEILQSCFIISVMNSAGYSSVFCKLLLRFLHSCRNSYRYIHKIFFLRNSSRNSCWDSIRNLYWNSSRNFSVLVIISPGISSRTSSKTSYCKFRQKSLGKPSKTLPDIGLDFCKGQTILRKIKTYVLSQKMQSILNGFSQRILVGLTINCNPFRNSLQSWLQNIIEGFLQAFLRKFL